MTLSTTTVGRKNVAAISVTDTANIINSLASKSCPSFLSVEPETSSRKTDVNVPFPNTQELSDSLVFKPMQDLQLLHRYKVKQIPLHMCASKSGLFLNRRIYQVEKVLYPLSKQWTGDTSNAQVSSRMEGRLCCLTYGSANMCTRKQALSVQNIRLIVSIPWRTHFPRPYKIGLAAYETYNTDPACNSKL